MNGPSYGGRGRPPGPGRRDAARSAETLCVALLASGGRGWCSDLDAIVAEFRCRGSTLTGAMRPVVLRHLRRCDPCASRLHPTLLRASDPANPPSPDAPGPSTADPRTR